MLACLWKLAAKAIGNDVILTEQHQIRKRREKMGFSKRLCFRALRLFRAPRGENLSTSQKDGTIALFQENYHILDWFGFVTHFPGNPENGGEACSGCVCLSWASSDRTVLNRDRETEKSLWEQRVFFFFPFLFSFQDEMMDNGGTSIEFSTSGFSIWRTGPDIFYHFNFVNKSHEKTENN